MIVCSRGGGGCHTVLPDQPDVIALVCGGRDFTDRAWEFRILDKARAKYGITAILHGGAAGADRYAKMWCRARGVPGIEIEALWEALGRSAGPIRNGWMLRFVRTDMVIAFPGGDGTKHMIETAMLAGIDVKRPKKATPRPTCEGGRGVL